MLTSNICIKRILTYRLGSLPDKNTILTEGKIMETKEKTVTIYRIEYTKAFMMGEQGEGYSLKPWGSNIAYYEGGDDGGQDYFLPDGCRLSQNTYTEICIYDDQDKYCPLFTSETGSPQILTTDGTITLKPVSKD